MIRLLIVEDQAVVSKGMQMLLSAEPDFIVVGETANSEEALELVKVLCPDVVLVDVDMPQVDGIELVQKINKYCPQSSVIFLSMQDDFVTSERAYEAGAVALVGKLMPTDILMAQIRQSCLTH